MSRSLPLQSSVCTCSKSDVTAILISRPLRPCEHPTRLLHYSLVTWLYTVHNTRLLLGKSQASMSVAERRPVWVQVPGVRLGHGADNDTHTAGCECLFLHVREMEMKYQFALPLSLIWCVDIELPPPVPASPLDSGWLPVTGLCARYFVRTPAERTPHRPLSGIRSVQPNERFHNSNTTARQIHRLLFSTRPHRPPAPTHPPLAFIR